jgi:periplasmic divalent cation tolerance protein
MDAMRTEPSEEDSKLEFKRLAGFANAAEAGMVGELLSNNGIRAVLKGANFGALEPLVLRGGFSEIELLVAEPDLPRAQQLYEAFFTRTSPPLDVADASMSEERSEERRLPETVEQEKSSATPGGALVVLTTTETQKDGEWLAHLLVERGLAACVQVLPQMKTVYRWQDHVERANETLLLIKTTREAYQDVEGLIRQNHQYQTPEILALPVIAGSDSYLEWLMAAVTARPRSE